VVPCPRLEAISALGIDRATRIGATLCERPAAEPLWDAITAVTIASQIAVRRWFAADPPVELRPLVREALGELFAAFADAARRIQPG